MTGARRIKQSILVYDKILIISFCVSCLYRNGPALNSQGLGLFNSGQIISKRVAWFSRELKDMNEIFGKSRVVAQFGKR